MTKTKPPIWFWIAGALLLLWGVVGVAGFAMDPAFRPASLNGMSDYDRQLYASRPTWAIWAYGIGTITGLVGTVALLMRRRDALAWYAVSLVAVVVLFGFELGATNLIAVKGFAAAVGLPIVIALLCLVEIALARHARRHGWIG